MTHTETLTDVGRAAHLLRSGRTVAIPTETVYGLAAVASNDEAVRAVFAAKGRPAGHPLIIHVASIEQAGDYGLLTPVARKLVDAFWPGPLTILVERTPLVSDAVTGGRDTVALRMPAHPLALEVIAEVGEGLVAPSANIFGHVSPTSAAHVLADLYGRIDAVLDGGECEVGVESTIVDCTDVPQVLRPGAVTSADIAAACGVAPVSPTGESRAAGMLASHYAPHARVVLAEDSGSAEELLRRLGPGATLMQFENTREYAARLYSAMRAADEQSCTHIVAVLPIGEGLAEAIRDRLRKAAADTSH